MWVYVLLPVWRLENGVMTSYTLLYKLFDQNKNGRSFIREFKKNLPKPTALTPIYPVRIKSYTHFYFTKQKKKSK